MCGSRQLFFQCGPETPKGWTPLVYCLSLLSLFSSCCLPLFHWFYFVVTCFDSFLTFFCVSSIGISFGVTKRLTWNIVITIYFKLITLITYKNAPLLLLSPPLYVMDVRSYIFYIVCPLILFYNYTYFYTLVTSMP